MLSQITICINDQKNDIIDINEILFNTVLLRQIVLIGYDISGDSIYASKFIKVVFIGENDEQKVY